MRRAIVRWLFRGSPVLPADCAPPCNVLEEIGLLRGEVAMLSRYVIQALDRDAITPVEGIPVTRVARDG